MMATCGFKIGVCWLTSALRPARNHSEPGQLNSFTVRPLDGRQLGFLCAALHAGDHVIGRIQSNDVFIQHSSNFDENWLAFWMTIAMGEKMTSELKCTAMSPNPKRVAILWKFPSLGLYSNATFQFLWTAIGHNNGNLAFAYAVANHITNPVKHYSWSTKAEILRDEADIIVIPCANQLGKHTNYGEMATNLEKSGLPIVAIGLGAQAESYDHDIEVTDGTLRWVRAIANSTPVQNIYTRGAYTTSQLMKLGIESLAGGCPSYFINDSVDLGAQVADRWQSVGVPRSLSVAAGHQSWMKTREIEHQLISMMMDPFTPGQYVVQSAEEMVKISRGIFDDMSSHAQRGLHNHTVPHYSFDEFKVWCRNYARSFYDVPSWMDSLRRYDLTVGTRYHGIALALQAGQMGLTITIDSRTRELCENTGVPNVDSASLTGPLTRQRLKALIKFDGDAYDMHRRGAARKYVSFLRNNGLEAASYLAKIADHGAAPSQAEAQNATG